jgi:ribosomal protein L40E
VVCGKCAASLPEGSEFCLKCGQRVNSASSRAGQRKTVSVATAALACSKCGAELPDGVEACAQCGKPVSMPAKNEAATEIPVEIIPPLPPPRRRLKRHVVLWAVLVLLVAAIVWVIASENPYAQGIQELVGWKHDQTILDTPFSVGPHTFRYYKFSLPEGSVNVAIVGQFTVSGESGKSTGNNATAAAAEKGRNDSEDQIEVYVLNEAAFPVWQNGYATSSVYESGRVSEGKVQAEIPAGAGIYYLVFNNKFSTRTAKNINADVLLRYKSWMPESLRKMKERFLNWMAL